MFADLHLHTHFSDGTFSPEELATQAAKYNLATISLTDHDTIEGCEPAEKACRERGVNFIPGTELTAELDNNEIHLLGYFLNTSDPVLLQEIQKFQRVRQSRIEEMVAKINQMGVGLKAEAVFKLANCKSPGRPHVARALVQGGFCQTLDEAFDRFLKKHRPAWVPKFRMSATDAIRLIHGAGGIAVMAHPGLNRTDQVIPILKEAGLDGLECYHTKHSPAHAEHYCRTARELGLAITGGSDCHGLNKGKPLIGTVRIPHVYVDQLRQRHQESQHRV
jgi:predicted metal-dependent phosphoesterase TrpH